MTQALAIYFVFGVTWMMTGLLPKPFGWLRHNMPGPIVVLWVIAMGAIWPLVFGKIVYGLFVEKQREIDL